MLPQIVSGIFLLLLPAFVKAQTILDIKPTAASVGSTITISGSGLVYKNLPTAVYFGTVPATVISQSSTALSVTVPVGASYDRITVVVSPTGTAVSEQFFLVQKGSPCAFKNPTFDAPVVVATAPNPPVFIELADMNSDGKEDLLVLSSDLKSTNALTIFSNVSRTGVPVFEKIYETSLGAIPTSLAVGDLNIDGFMDIVIGYTSGNVITIIPGATGTTFSKPGSITVGIKNIVIPRYIAINDLDADNIPDIITGNANAKEGISILRKTALSGFAYSTAAVAVTTGAVTSIDIGDLNQDGTKDIITAEYDGKQRIGYYYSGKDNFTSSTAISSVTTNPILAGDYDQNGLADVVLGFDGVIGTYSEQNGNQQSDQAFSGTPSSMAGSDYNSDGKADLAAIFVDAKTTENYLAFYINDGSGGLQFNKQYIATGFKGKANLASSDVDQDGQTDLVLSEPNKNNISVYLKSSSVIIDPQTVTTTTPCESAAATVTAEINEGTVRWYDSKGSTLITTGSSAQIPATYLPSSKNTVYYQGASGKCTTTLTPLTILVNPLPDATASSPSPYICQDAKSVLQSVDVNGTVTGATYTYQWTTSDVASPNLPKTSVLPFDKTLITGTGSAGQFPAEKTTIYTYNLTVTNPTTGCVKTSSVAINVYSYAAAVTSSVNTICSGANVSFTASITNGTFNSTTPFKWSNNYGLSNPSDGIASTSLNPVNTTTAASNLTFTITGQTAMGCPVTASKTVIVNAPQVITPSSLPRTIINSGPYAQVFKTSSGSNATFKMVQIKDPLPTQFSFTGNTFQGTPTTPYKGTFLITSTETGQCPGSAQYTFIVDDLADPNLIVFPMYKNVGDQPFFIQPITQSAGDITYSFKNAQDPNAGCVTVGPKGYVTITCAASTDSIPVIVTQAATAKYKKSTIETFIKVSPSKDTKVLLATSGVIAGADTTSLKYYTNSDADKSAIEFVQLNNTDIAEIKPDGTIVPGTQTGTVDVEIRIPATLNYAAVTRTFTITVYAAVQKPIVSTDTVVITVGQDTIINILENDLGVTRAIDPAKTDIDMENNGVQNKYYSLTMGNFLVDLNGNLQIKPFSGFIGEGKLGYTVTDSAGVKSDIGYVLIKVVPLTVTPPLQANEVMTPNSDGYNDGLVIAYANLNPNNSLTIMDESGNVVYETTNYQNDWTGINKKGKLVEAGVYFYVYQEKDSGRGLTQYIQVVR